MAVVSKAVFILRSRPNNERIGPLDIPPLKSGDPNALIAFVSFVGLAPSIWDAVAISTKVA